MNNDFDNLKRDYDSCQMPLWDDPMTIKTLWNIVNSIRCGEYPKSEFDDFANKELGKSDFGKGCRRFVELELLHLGK